MEQRFGEIYALERIDKESYERSYHSMVIAVLTAYVWEDAPSSPKASEIPVVGSRKPPGGDSVSDVESEEIAEQDKGSERDAELTPKTPSADIQAILDVLNRREEDDVPEEHRVQYLDLRGTVFRGANLREAYLKETQVLKSGQIQWTYGIETTTQSLRAS